MRIISAIYIVVVLSLSAAFSGNARAADSLKVRLDWTPWGVQAPFHLAAKKQLFAKHGLDVVLEDGNGSVATVQIVGNGTYDVGHASLATMAIARSKGLPILAIAGFIRQNDIGLMVGTDLGIEGPRDLKGKKLAFTAGSLETPFLDRFLAKGGLKRTDVELTNVDAANKGGLYIAGRVDGAFSSAPFMQPVLERLRPTKTIRFSDYGFDLPSFGLFATEASIASKKEALKRFASITAACWTYIFDGHEDEAVQAIIDARPQAKLNPVVLRRQIDTLKGLVATPTTQGKTIGLMTDSDWEKSVETLKQGDLIDHVDPPSHFYTNELIDDRLVQEVARELN
jgi:NitT/TauT family transport system substrate-binding protein